jgi:hypothetical protein
MAPGRGRCTRPSMTLLRSLSELGGGSSSIDMPLLTELRTNHAGRTRTSAQHRSRCRLKRTPARAVPGTADRHSKRWRARRSLCAGSPAAAVEPMWRQRCAPSFGSLRLLRAWVKCKEATRRMAATPQSKRQNHETKSNETKPHFNVPGPMLDVQCSPDVLIALADRPDGTRRPCR